jgi:hypothetical protein
MRRRFIPDPTDWSAPSSMEATFTPALPQQARLGELAIIEGHIRKRIRHGEGVSGVSFPLPYPRADMATLGGNLAKPRLREKDRMRGDPESNSRIQYQSTTARDAANSALPWTIRCKPRKMQKVQVKAAGSPESEMKARLKLMTLLMASNWEHSECWER